MRVENSRRKLIPEGIGVVVSKFIEDDCKAKFRVVFGLSIIIIHDDLLNLSLCFVLLYFIPNIH